jgi:hypothetical protein
LLFTKVILSNSFFHLGAHALHRRLFVEHQAAEYRIKTEGYGRTVDEWK